MRRLIERHFWQAILIAVASYIGITFGYEIAHYRGLVEALNELEKCQKHADCVQAMERLVVAKGGR